MNPYFSFPKIRAYLESHPTITPRSAALVLNTTRYKASNSLTAWCRQGKLERVECSVYKIADDYAPKVRPNVETRVLMALRDHGMNRAATIQVHARVGAIKVVRRALTGLCRVGLVSRASRGLYQVVKESHV